MTSNDIDICQQFKRYFKSKQCLHDKFLECGACGSVDRHMREFFPTVEKLGQYLHEIWYEEKVDAGLVPVPWSELHPDAKCEYFKHARILMKKIGDRS